MFAGGCSYDSAEQVAGADPDTLQSLLDKSLLRRRDSPGGPRYWMLETIREYAAEQLDAADETGELQHRHLDHYAEIAADCYDETWGGHDDLERLDAERDNLRLALDRGLETNLECALRPRDASHALLARARPIPRGAGEARGGARQST